MVRFLLLLLFFGNFQLQALTPETEEKIGIPLVRRMGDTEWALISDELRERRSAQEAIDRSLASSIAFALNSISPIRAGSTKLIPQERVMQQFKEAVLGVNLKKNALLSQRFFAWFDTAQSQEVCCETLLRDFDYNGDEFEQVVGFLRSRTSSESRCFLSKTRIRKQLHDVLYLESALNLIYSFLSDLEKEGFRPLALTRIKEPKMAVSERGDSFNENYAKLLAKEQADVYAYRVKFLAQLREFYEYVRPSEERGASTLMFSDPLYILSKDRPIVAGVIRHFTHNEPLPETLNTESTENLEALEAVW